MSFTLEVELSALCMYLVHPTTGEIGVALPDARVKTTPDALRHADNTPAKAHVGYLRFDLADTGAIVPRGNREAHDGEELVIEHPQYEVVHLFDFEDLDFGFDEEPVAVPDDDDFLIAEVEEFAPGLVPVPGLFGNAPPKELLMRTILRGGELTAPGDFVTWMIDPTLDRARSERYSNRFGGFTKWTRTVDADHITLRLSSLTGEGEPTSITLRPGPDGVVKLKIANLCTENPLEWEELGVRRVSATHVDDDFKWFYKLLQHPTLRFDQVLTRSRLSEGLPCPQRDPDVVEVLAAGTEAGDCGQARIAHNFRT